MRSVKRRLRGDRATLDGFLDAVQLQKSKNPPSSASFAQIPTDEESLDRIKDKVDEVARRVFGRRDSGLADVDDEDKLWKQFKAELEKEGFSPAVLRKHKVRSSSHPSPTLPPSSC